MLTRKDLTSDERKCFDLLVRAGKVDGGGVRIRAEVVSQIALREGPLGSGVAHFRRLHLEGLEVFGPLDMTDSDTGAAIMFKNCHFTSSIDISRSMFNDLWFEGCAIEGEVLAQAARIRNNLLVNDSTMLGGINLTMASIGGVLNVRGSAFHGSSDVCFVFDGGAVDGPVLVSGCSFGRAASLRATRFKTQVVLENLSFISVETTSPSGSWLSDRDDSRSESELLLDKSDFGSELRIEGIWGVAHLSARSLSSASDVTISGLRWASSGRSLNVGLAIDRALIKGGLLIEDSDIGHGATLTGSEVGILVVRRSRFAAPSVEERDGVELLVERVGPQSYAMAADGISVRSDIVLGPGFDALGETRFIGADVGGQIQLRGEQTRKVQVALNLEEADVRSTVFLDQVHADSEIHMPGGRFGAIFLDPREIPHVSLHYASFRWIGDETGAQIAGEAAVKLLARSSREPSIVPYRAVAEWLRAQGDDRGAQLVFIAGENSVKAGARGFVVLAHWIWHWSVGYGYAPLRALPVLALLVVIGSTIFAIAYGGELTLGFSLPWFSASGDTGFFNPVLAALRAIVPGVFDWYWWVPVSPVAQLTAILLSIAGWTLVTAVVAGIANRVRRGRD